MNSRLVAAASARHAPAGPEAPSGSNGALLKFLDGWELLNTKDLAFEKVLPREDSSELEVIRELDSMRRSTCVKQSTIKEQVDPQHLERFERYLNELHKLIPKMEPIDQPSSSASSSAAKFEWTSPMAGRPSQFFKLSGLKLEQAMASFQFAGALRSLAFSLSQQQAAAAQPLFAKAASFPVPSSSSSVTAGTGSEGGASAAGPLAEAATCLRRAAGVLQWLAERALPMARPHLPPDRPAEMLSCMATVMQTVCLAEAQAVTAWRAGQRGNSASVVAALYAGASELYERAARTLKINLGELTGGVSDRLRRYLAISAALQRARAFRYLGEDLCSKEQAGQGEAACLEADRVVQACLPVAEGDASWQALLRAEQGTIEETRKRIQRDREGLYYQTVAKTAPEQPAPKVLVKPLDYSPGASSAPSTD